MNNQHDTEPEYLTRLLQPRPYENLKEFTESIPTRMRYVGPGEWIKTIHQRFEDEFTE